jgi:hypothetical protein
MSPTFQSDSPLVQVVMNLLRQQPEGLTIPDLRRALIKAGRTGVLERDIEEIVRLREFHRLPGGRIILREMEQELPPTPDEVEASRPELPYADHPSTLRDFPSLESFIIFDVETNGLDPESADFFQLSAIKVVDGQPVATFDEYARVDTKSITRALRVKLHFDELGLEEKIQQAGTPMDVVQSFQTFAGDSPLVAHNGNFDMGFLHKHTPDLPNQLVDSLELACLAFLTALNH